MQGLTVQHDCHSLGGAIQERLEERGVAFDEFLVVDDIFNPVSDKHFPNPDDYDFVLVMGAPWSVYDEALIGSWIGREIEFLQQADTLGIPVFGICFGAQLLSVALGGSAQLAAVAELGWYKVTTAVPEFIAEGPWMQWHKDAFTPPPGAEVLAKSPAGVQAMRLGTHLGVQFHPEMTPDVLAGWRRDGGDDELREAGIDPEDLARETDLSSQLARPAACRLADYFLDECVKA